MEEKLCADVLKLISKCSKEIGKYEEDSANQNLFYECLELEMESPIEQMVYCALRTACRLNAITEADPIEVNGSYAIRGFEIEPQAKIGKYRVDFRITQYGSAVKKPQPQKSVIVECDSQEFHERTEKQRRYEKARDRMLTTKGLKVFHFTGKEILHEPMRVAAEIIAFVMDIDIDDIQLDSNIE